MEKTLNDVHYNFKDKIIITSKGVLKMFKYNKTFLVEVSTSWVDCHCQQWIVRRHKHIGLVVLFPNYNSDLLLSFLIKTNEEKN